jgi:flagellar export protein FliJ
MLAAQRQQAALLLERSSTQQQAEMLSQEIERRRAALVEAEKQVRVLEKLAIRRTQQARQRAGAREAKRLDELASLRWKAGQST